MDSLSLDILPKIKSRYNWEASMGLVFDCELDGINYKLKIVDKQGNYIKVKPLGFYNNYTFNIRIQNFARMKFKKKIIATLCNPINKELLNYLSDEQKKNLNELSRGSHDKLELTCPLCNYKKEMRLATIRKGGFSCPICSDGVSYPQKVMHSILKQNNIEYRSEEVIEGYRYDFFIPSLNTVIETHGRQHYIETTRTSLANQIETDSKKELLVVSLGMQYIAVDCSYSDVSYIENNLPQEIRDIAPIIDWSRTATEASLSYKIEAWDLKNKGMSVKEIAQKLD